MKRALSLVILIGCFFFLYQFAVSSFKQTHEVKYAIKNGNVVFQVREKYENKKYYFEIQKDQLTFYFDSNNSFNKMQQVIQNIEYFEKDGMSCIYPNFKKNVSGSIVCNDGGQIYAYESLKNHGTVLQFSQILKEKGYIPIHDQEYKETEGQSGAIYYYPSAIDENIVVWNYQGFVVIDSARSLSQTTLLFDRYENTISKLVGKYYVTPLYTDNRLYEFSSLYVFDVTTHEEKNIALGAKLSNYSYLNGVVGKKMYLFDPSSMQQWEIDPKGEDAVVIATKSQDGNYYNGAWSTRNIYDFVSEKIRFKTFDESIFASDRFFISAYESGDSYYFYDGYSFHQIYKNCPEYDIVLFEQQDMKEIKVIDGYVYYIAGDTLYKYSPHNRVRRVVQYKEFMYNSENIYDIYRK